MALAYFFVGILWCVTIIGIPVGLQIFKLGTFALWPFGREIASDTNDGGCLSILLNVLWIIFGGIELALAHVSVGIVLCVTIIGIPFGLQHFKMAMLALIPFGKKVV